MIRCRPGPGWQTDRAAGSLNLVIIRLTSAAGRPVRFWRSCTSPAPPGAFSAAASDSARTPGRSRSQGPCGQSADGVEAVEDRRG